MSEELTKSGKPRHAGMFKPGQSGNPSGRPKENYRVSELAKEHTEEALAALMRVIRDPKAPHSAVVNAATAVLDRAWGKPPQFQMNQNVDISFTDLVKQIAEREARFQAVTTEAIVRPVTLDALLGITCDASSDNASSDNVIDVEPEQDFNYTCESKVH